MRVFCLILLVALASADLAPLHKAKEPIAGKFLIGLKSNVDVDAIGERLENTVFSGTLKSTLLKKFKGAFNGFVAKMDDEMVEKIRGLDFVDYIEEDGMVYTSVTWGLDRVDQRDLPLNNYFSVNGKGNGVNVYVIDTGINPSHTEFGGRAAVAYDATGGDGIDCNGHGTHCAGTIAGYNYGVAKEANIYGVRVFGCSGGSSTSTIIDGINYVYWYGSQPGVVSMSLGGGASTSEDNAVTNLINKGFTVVVAAGNDNANACYYSPARVDAAITVGATDSYDTRSSFSNYGNCVDIFAPGSSITSAWWTSNRATNTISGTSMATPHVSGVAAVLRGNGYSNSQTRSKILSDASSNRISSTGWGSPNLLLYVD
ncbi:aqualysin-1-like [Anneissia japonica]|uniref:aqualysin-1-like n=1 Tax=Anneissia japonica TaxID=1529436 RepID=UPI001425B653|nr:aqualysin-1-like [Anneissia japonica]